MKAKKLNNSRNTTFLHLFVMLLLAAAVTYLGQIPASMQNSITPENSANRGRTGRDIEAKDDTVCDAPAVSTNIGFATTLRFPAGGGVENNIVSFNLATPGTLITDVPILGLNAATFENIQAIDFRPSTGELYGIANPGDGTTNTFRLVRINTTTGATTQVGTPITAANAGNFGAFDFNPVVDRIRFTVLQAPGRDLNFRLDPDTGVATPDTGLQFAAGDPNAAADEFIVGNAYTNNTAPAPATTTLYAIDSALDILVTQGSINGTPVSPNAGTLFTVGALGVNTSGLVGFDINSSNVAYAILDTIAGTGAFGSPGRLYTINLGTGAATLVGAIGGATNRFTAGFSIGVAPPAATLCSTQAEFEPNNDFTTANNMTTANRVIGAITPAGDADYYRIDNVPANALLFAFTDTGDGPLNNTGGTNSRDSQLEVFAADGTTRIEFDDDDAAGNGGDGTSETGFASAVAGTTLTAGGTYYIRIDGFNPATTIINQYNLFVRVVAPTPATAEVEPNDTSATATPLVLGQLATGTLVTLTDQDFFSVALTAGNTVDLALDGDPERNASTATPNVNHQLALIGPDGTTVLFNANSGVVVNSATNPEAEAFAFVVPTTGTYFVRVLTASTVTTAEGTYRLVVNQCNTAATAATASVSGRVLSSSGKALSGISLTLTGGDGAVQSVRTLRNGSYRFDNVTTGQTYVLEARSKRFTFSPQVITVNENLEDVDFIASP